MICEILAESGATANREQLVALARRFDMPLVSVEQLAQYRQEKGKVV